MGKTAVKRKSGSCDTDDTDDTEGRLSVFEPPTERNTKDQFPSSKEGPNLKHQSEKRTPRQSVPAQVALGSRVNEFFGCLQRERGVPLRGATQDSQGNGLSIRAGGGTDGRSEEH